MPQENRRAATASPQERAEPLPHRHVPVRLGPPAEGYVSGAPPIKEGPRRPVSNMADRSPEAGKSFTGDVEATGERVTYLLVKAEQGELETPAFPVGAQGDAVAVFTSREQAVLYLQVARWDQYRIEDLTPTQLARWLENTATQGIRCVLVDPNYREQARGVEPQALLDLQALRDFTGENVFREVQALGKS